MKLKEPMLIIFDGLDNCGKSTQIVKLANYIRNKNNIMFLSPPSWSLRKFLNNIESNDLIPSNDVKLSLRSINYALAVKAMSLAYEHNRMARELLSNRTTVFIDRWLYSTFIYNCIESDLQRTCDLVYKDTLGDLITFNFFIDTKVKTCIERCNKEEKDNISILSNEKNLKSVYNRHKETENGNFSIRNNITIIDGDDDEDTVFESILLKIKEKV